MGCFGLVWWIWVLLVGVTKCLVICCFDWFLLRGCLQALLWVGFSVLFCCLCVGGLLAEHGVVCWLGFVVCDFGWIRFVGLLGSCVLYIWCTFTCRFGVDLSFFRLILWLFCA